MLDRPFLTQIDPRAKIKGSRDPLGLQPILNMALDGLDRLREREHFEIPSDVKAASEVYQTINDVPKLFIVDCCQTGPD